MRKSEKGFSILEVLIGISIFAIGLLGLMALQISSMRTLSFSGNRPGIYGDPDLLRVVRGIDRRLVAGAGGAQGRPYRQQKEKHAAHDHREAARFVRSMRRS